jgi:hypothetical protein
MLASYVCEANIVLDFFLFDTEIIFIKKKKKMNLVSETCEFLCLRLNLKNSD